MESSQPKQFSVTLIDKRQLTHSVYWFRFATGDHEEFRFLPGQYSTFIIEPTIRRQYSFCSAPDPRVFELVVDVSPGGIGSRYFLNIGIGQTAQVLAPLGNFTVDTQSPHKRVLVATGTGIAPYRSFILQAMSDQTLRVPPVALYWGLRHEDDVYWDREFLDIAATTPGFSYTLSLSKPGPGWQGRTGHVTEQVLGSETDPKNCDFYLCGNNAMIAQLQQKLTESGVPATQIKKDIFY